MLPHKLRTKVSETLKLVGRLPIPRAILLTSFRVKSSKIKVTKPTNYETDVYHMFRI